MDEPVRDCGGCSPPVLCLQTDFKPYLHIIPLADLFRFLDHHLDRHKIETVFREQGGLKLGLADPRVDGNHSPAIRDLS